MEMNTVDGKRFNTDGPKFTKRVCKKTPNLAIGIVHKTYKNSLFKTLYFSGESKPKQLGDY